MLFSIITVTFNNLEGLKKTAASVQSQSFPGYEWLVIDGGSVDGSADYLNSLGALFVSEPDAGIYDAMNKGIQKAGGFYTIFMNAGDEFVGPDTLAQIASYIEEVQETPNFIYGDALEEIPGQKEPAYKQARPYKKSVWGMFTHHQAMLYRQDIIAAQQYDLKYSIAADYKFTLQALEESRTVLYCPFPICLFESGGVSQQKIKQGRIEQKKIRAEMNTTGALKNNLVAMKQFMASVLRKTAPGLFWHLKGR